MIFASISGSLTSSMSATKACQLSIFRHLVLSPCPVCSSRKQQGHQYPASDAESSLYVLTTMSTRYSNALASTYAWCSACIWSLHLTLNSLQHLLRLRKSSKLRGRSIAETCRTARPRASAIWGVAPALKTNPNRLRPKARESNGPEQERRPGSAALGPATTHPEATGCKSRVLDLH